jgi:hypothetical protein
MMTQILGRYAPYLYALMRIMIGVTAVRLRSEQRLKSLTFW